MKNFVFPFPFHHTNIGDKNLPFYVPLCSIENICHSGHRHAFISIWLSTYPSYQERFRRPSPPLSLDHQRLYSVGTEKIPVTYFIEKGLLYHTIQGREYEAAAPVASERSAFYDVFSLSFGTWTISKKDHSVTTKTMGDSICQEIRKLTLSVTKLGIFIHTQPPRKKSISKWQHQEEKNISEIPSISFSWEDTHWSGKYNYNWNQKTLSAS